MILFQFYFIFLPMLDFSAGMVYHIGMEETRIGLGEKVQGQDGRSFRDRQSNRVSMVQVQQDKLRKKYEYDKTIPADRGL